MPTRKVSLGTQACYCLNYFYSMITVLRCIHQSPRPFDLQQSAPLLSPVKLIFNSSDIRPIVNFELLPHSLMIGWCHTLTALHRIDPFFFISFIQYHSWVGAIQEPYFFSLSPVTRFMYFILTFLVEGEFPGRHLYKPWNSVSVCSRPSFWLQLMNQSYQMFFYDKGPLNLFAHLPENLCQLLAICQENWIRIK